MLSPYIKFIFFVFINFFAITGGAAVYKVVMDIAGRVPVVPLELFSAVVFLGAANFLILVYGDLGE